MSGASHGNKEAQGGWRGNASRHLRRMNGEAVPVARRINHESSPRELVSERSAMPLLFCYYKAMYKAVLCLTFHDVINIITSQDTTIHLGPSRFFARFSRALSFHPIAMSCRFNSKASTALKP